MTRNSRGRNLFLIGALIGVLSGVILRTVATVGIGDKVAELAHRLIRKLFGRQQSVRFELLGQ